MGQLCYKYNSTSYSRKLIFFNIPYLSDEPTWAINKSPNDSGIYNRKLQQKMVTL
jgi:hypothetical protein